MGLFKQCVPEGSISVQQYLLSIFRPLLLAQNGYFIRNSQPILGKLNVYIHVAMVSSTSMHIYSLYMEFLTSKK